MVFHLVRRVVAYRVLVTLHLINKAGAEPLQFAIRQAFPLSVGSLDVHIARQYDPMNGRLQSGELETASNCRLWALSDVRGELW